MRMLLRHDPLVADHVAAGGPEWCCRRLIPNSGVWSGRIAATADDAPEAGAGM
jgi:hypothetical protein